MKELRWRVCRRSRFCMVFLATLAGRLLGGGGAPARAADKAAPLVVGETFTLDSKVLGETRRTRRRAYPFDGPPSEGAAPPPCRASAPTPLDGSKNIGVARI
jgi:hypothetical protein